jgi:hypothetical protein
MLAFQVKLNRPVKLPVGNSRFDGPLKIKKMRRIPRLRGRGKTQHSGKRQSKPALFHHCSF